MQLMISSDPVRRLTGEAIVVESEQGQVGELAHTLGNYALKQKTSLKDSFSNRIC